MAGMNRGDLVLLQDCEQVGEVLCAGIAGRLLLRLPLLDAVVLVRESAVQPLDSAGRLRMDQELQELQQEADAYLQVLMQNQPALMPLHMPLYMAET